MITTTSYGTWTTVERYSASLESTVADALGDFVDDYDFEGLVAEYRQAISAALPAGVSLCGDEFYGPAYAADRTWDGELDLKALVDEIDFWDIAARHDRSSHE